MQQGQEKLPHKGRSKYQCSSLMSRRTTSLHPHMGSVLIVAEAQLSVKQKSKTHHRRLKQN